MKRDILSCKPFLRGLARTLRQNMTLAEVWLWKRLKGDGVAEYDVDRQCPMDGCIVENLCKHLMLAIEVDGASHHVKEQAGVGGLS